MGGKNEQGLLGGVQRHRNFGSGGSARQDLLTEAWLAGLFSFIFAFLHHFSDK